MHRRSLLSVTAALVPVAAVAQPAPTPPWRGSGPPRSQAERDERHRWLADNWDALPPDQRRAAEERFGRGMGPRGPGPGEMRQRWQGMTPGQREELMFGPRMGRGPRRGPPVAPPPPSPGSGG